MRTNFGDGTLAQPFQVELAGGDGLGQLLLGDEVQDVHAHQPSG